MFMNAFFIKALLVLRIRLLRTNKNGFHRYDKGLPGNRRAQLYDRITEERTSEMMTTGGTGTRGGGGAGTAGMVTSGGMADRLQILRSLGLVQLVQRFTAETLTSNLKN